MLDFSKSEGIPKIPVSKKIVGDDKCFLLQSIADSSEKIGIKRWDWLLFKNWNPKQWDIVVLGDQEDQRIYKLWIYNKNEEWYFVMRSILEDNRPVIISEYVSIYGILKKNLWKYW